MDYIVKENENTTTTFSGERFKVWDESSLYSGIVPVNDLIATLKVVQAFKKKYPNDDTVFAFDEILRDEICQIFGGELRDED